MRKITVFILFSFLGQASFEAAFGLRRFVLVAGANDGGAERATLRYAVSDARSEIVFYYSDHADENGLLLGSEHLPYETLRQQ